MADQSIAIYPHRICYVEDSNITSQPIQYGMEKLLGARVDLFETTNFALQQLRAEGMEKWGTFILDNNTGHGAMRGTELAQIIKKECHMRLL